jgi:hypothetical protein
MNIKFEWTEHSGPFGPRYRCWCGPVWVGEVLVSVGNISAAFGGDDKTQEGEWYGAVFERGNGKFLPVFHGEPECSEPPVCTTLDEAKAWVEEQARAWLKEVVG